MLCDVYTAMLTRSSANLVTLSVSFLKKLSVFEENKDVMIESGIVSKLARFIPCSSQELVIVTLRLLFNLSFDKVCALASDDMMMMILVFQRAREQMVKASLMPKLVNLLKTASLRGRTLKLLYHLSVDDRCKSMFMYTDGVPMIMGMVINFPQPVLAKELAALAVNLSYNPGIAELMIANRGLSHLMDRLASTRDPLLLKIIRNISLWSFNVQRDLPDPELDYKYRGLWSPYLKTLLSLIVECDNHDFLVEALGTLANLTTLDLPASLPWAKIVREYSLLNLFSKLLIPGMAQNDLVLELVMLLSAIAVDAQACAVIASTNIFQLLHKLWVERGKDDMELLLQLVHCFHRSGLHYDVCSTSLCS